MHQRHRRCYLIDTSALKPTDSLGFAARGSSQDAVSSHTSPGRVHALATRAIMTQLPVMSGTGRALHRANSEDTVGVGLLSSSCNDALSGLQRQLALGAAASLLGAPAE